MGERRERNGSDESERRKMHTHWERKENPHENKLAELTHVLKLRKLDWNERRDFGMRERGETA